ncbi:MAG: UvrD-helicase domain-containing protein [Candidatus Heimdallarchaeota archaeon]
MQSNGQLKGYDMALSEKQISIVEQRGKFVVKACPGSGKTFSVAHRLSEMLSGWGKNNQGIAALSFTNVAWQEVQKQLTEMTGYDGSLGHPHHIGTIDSFLNQYVIMPFGKHSIGCENSPQLIGPPVNDWEPSETYGWGKRICQTRKCKLNQISINADGSIYNLKSDACPIKYRQCIRLKKMLLKNGLLTQSDANYFSLKVLQKQPRIAKYIVSRFPVMMIDEAQDTSEIQMAIIDILIENGLSEIMLIGDPNQAIFEWRKARPDLFIAKYDEWIDNSIVLDESFRSSQAICDFSDKLSCPGNGTVSNNTEATGLNISPEIVGYNENSINDVLPSFIERCEQLNIMPDENDIVVLARSNNFVRSLQGSSNDNLYPWNNDFTRDLCRSKYLYEMQKPVEGFNCLEKAVCKEINNIPYCDKETLVDTIEKFGFSCWRKMLFKLLQSLPSTDDNLGNWVTFSKPCFDEFGVISCDILKIKRGKQYKEMIAKDAFQFLELEEADLPYRSGTIHSIKGESCDAVLLVLKKKGYKRKYYVNMLDDELLRNEEMRIVYVALTRARKAVFLAVPEEHLDAWKNKFAD